MHRFGEATWHCQADKQVMHKVSAVKVWTHCMFKHPLLCGDRWIVLLRRWRSLCGYSGVAFTVIDQITQTLQYSIGRPQFRPNWALSGACRDKMHTCRTIHTLVQHGVWRQGTHAIQMPHVQFGGSWWQGLGCSLQVANLQPVPFELWDRVGLIFASHRSSWSIF